MAGPGILPRQNHRELDDVSPEASILSGRSDPDRLTERGVEAMAW